MGHCLTAKGVQPAKVKAIVEMPSPQSKKVVECFLGCVTYLSRFSPQLAKMVQPIRQLTEENVEFMWQTQQASALDRVKKCLTDAPKLSVMYFTKRGRCKRMQHQKLSSRGTHKII